MSVLSKSKIWAYCIENKEKGYKKPISLRQKQEQGWNIPNGGNKKDVNKAENIMIPDFQK